MMGWMAVVMEEGGIFPSLEIGMGEKVTTHTGAAKDLMDTKGIIEVRIEAKAITEGKIIPVKIRGKDRGDVPIVKNLKKKLPNKILLIPWSKNRGSISTITKA